MHEHKPDGWIEKLSLIVRQVTAEDVLRQCARAFLANGDDERAKEVYVKLDDVESLLGLYVRKQDWEAALKLAEDPSGTFSEATRAKFDEALYLPYAEWLAVHDRFDEALEAYRRSGREDRAARMVQSLTFNAVVESRFKDASYYYWLLALNADHVYAVVIPDDDTRLQNIIIKFYHEAAGHAGGPATWRLIRNKYVWKQGWA